VPREEREYPLEYSTRVRDKSGEKFEGTR